MKSRFAPSPTGYLHIGGARTALFAWLWAKKNNGKFLLRIEDTDIKRSTQASIDAILQGIDWLGLDYDEGPIYQTKRLNRYEEIVNKLLKEGKAYYCGCSKNRLDKLREEKIAVGEKAKYDGFCRNKNLSKGVIRFLNPDKGKVAFRDYVKGDIEIANSELDDLIIVRSDGSPTYNLTVVVDDHDMAIDCVVRGDDHINNTPKQINLYNALNWDLPSFAHVPMILGVDGARLSKRHNAVNVMAYRDQGFLPEALLNYIVRLGWSHGDQEIFSLAEMVDLFDLNNINKAPASFNQDKLLWINQSYIKTTEIAELAKHLHWHLASRSIDLTKGPAIETVLECLKDRSKTLVEMADSCVMFYKDFKTFDDKQARKQFDSKTQPIIEALNLKLSTLGVWNAIAIKDVIKDVCEQEGVGFGKVGQPFRLALSGDGNAGSIDICAELVGKDKTLARLQMAIDYIKNI